MRTKASIIISIVALCVSLACLAVCLNFVNAGKQEQVEVKDEGDVQYVLYLGTNDKDTNEPVFEPEEARRVLEGILIAHMGGYTIQEARGGWIDDSGQEYQEYTLVIYLSDTDIDSVHALCDELIATYNQSSVLIQMNKTVTEFYSSN